MLQIIHRRRKGTLGAAFLALLLVVSAWPCPQSVEAEGEKTQSPKVVILNEAEAFKNRKKIADLGLSTTAQSDALASLQDSVAAEKIDYGTKYSKSNIAMHKLSEKYLKEAEDLLNDYRKLAGIPNSQVTVDTEFHAEDSNGGVYSPQQLAFINMYMGMSAGSFGHKYSEPKAQRLLDAIKEQVLPSIQTDALADNDHIYNKNNLLMDGSFSRETLESNNGALQQNLIKGWKKEKEDDVHLFNFANGSPLDYKTARGPIGGWIQEGYDYENSTVPKADLNLGHRSILLNNDLEELHIGAALGYDFQYYNYFNQKLPEGVTKEQVNIAHFSAAGWVEPPTKRTRLSTASASVIAFPAPGVFPSEFINPQCTVWTLELGPEVYKVDKSKLSAEIREYSESNQEGDKLEPNISLYKDDLDRPILAIEPPASQTGKSVPQGKATAKDFPSVYNLAPLEGKTYVVTIKGVQDQNEKDIAIQYWVMYRSIHLQEGSSYALKDEEAKNRFEWIAKTLKSGSSEPNPNPNPNPDPNPNPNPNPNPDPNPNPNPNPNPDPEPTPQPPAPQPKNHDDDTTSKGPQVPPPPKPGGSSSKFGNWKKGDKDGRTDEEDDESDTLFGSKYSRNRGPQSKQLRFQGPMAAPQGPGNQSPAGMPAPMPIAPQNMGQGVMPQGVNQVAMPQGVNQAAMPVAANNVLQQVPETGEISFQPWVLGALLGAVALILAKRRKI